MPSRPALPLVHVAYAVGQGGCLTRCDATAFPRGGLMGLSDRCTGAIPRIDTLCRTIVAECVKRGFQGVLADFETNPYSDRLSFLSRLSARLSARRMALYCPLSPPGRGRSASRRHWPFRRVAARAAGGNRLPLWRGASGARLGTRNDGLSPPLSLRLRHTAHARRTARPAGKASIVRLFFPRADGEYFTYSAGSGTHFVLFDDAETLRQKVRLAQGLGIQTAFLMFPEISDLLPEL